MSNSHLYMQETEYGAGLAEWASLLITGSRGLVGRAIAKHFPGAIAATHRTLDIADITALNSYDWSNIRYIVNAAALVNIEYSETPEGLAKTWDVNAFGVSNLAKIALKHDITLIQFCSDYVFDGKCTPHREDESVSPLNVYGQSKAASSLITSIVPQHYVIRTSWVFGEGRNFVDTMVKFAASDISPTVVADQVGRPTSTALLANAIEHILHNRLPFGTYNVTNSGDEVSWAEVARETFSLIERPDLKVKEVTTQEYQRQQRNYTARPLGSTLALDKIESTGIAVIDWREAIKQHLQGD
jgi:dTDP-4-dehydrorhamnose 3,5-epimerase/reductase